MPYPVLKNRRSPYTRVRSDSSLQFVQTVYVDKNTDKVSGAIVYSDSTPRSVSRGITIGGTMIDTVSPGFEFIKADGGIVNNPMSKSTAAFTCGDTGFAVESFRNDPAQTTIHELSFSGGGLTRAFGAPVATGHTMNIQNLQTLATTATLAGVKPSNLMGLVSLAEGVKTLNMILKPLSSLNAVVKHLTQLRRGNKNIAIISNGNTLVVNGKKFLRPGAWYNQGPGKFIRPPTSSIVIPAGSSISGTVLANNLGLRPLCMDLQAFLKDIPQLHQHERLSSRRTFSDEQTQTRSDTLSYGNAVHTCDVTTLTKVTVRVSVLYVDKFDILQDFGVSISDIPSAAWELIPYSFVFDYMTNIGDLLAASQAVQTQSIIASSMVTVVDTTVNRTWTGSTSSSPWTVIRPASGIDSYTSTTKVRVTELPNPFFAYRPMHNIFNASHIANSLSLTVQGLIALTKR